MYAQTAAEALFASALQPSDRATRDQVDGAIRGSLAALGGARGCAVAVAGAYGENPEAAVVRMRWALSMIRPPKQDPAKAQPRRDARLRRDAQVAAQKAHG
jgi:hypothetical protein